MNHFNSVIPAKAGINKHQRRMAFTIVIMDPRLRGGDAAGD